MTIDVWGDVICPFCYLGKRQLERALALFSHADQVRLRHRAFELDSHSRVAYDVPLVELVARKYGRSVAEATVTHERLEREAAAWDMNWNLATAQPSNTLDAHRLIALGASQGVGDATVERLLVAYFVDSERVSDPEVLARIGDEIGVRGVAAMLASDLYVNDV